jgi:ethanolamine utilization protein EutA
MTIRIAEKRMNSVGVDVGTSTSHLVFSELVLKKDPSSKTEKFYVAERNIKHRGDIILTPLHPVTNEIDIDRLLPALLHEYQKANIDPASIDSGAVIITGESAKRNNAEKIVQFLAKEAQLGNFVASTAGPNFESMISAYGSGAVTYSVTQGKKVIHSDVGGGTTNIAVIDNGIITATACINVGGRLIAFNDANEIVRLETAGRWILEACNLTRELGEGLAEEEKVLVSQKMADSLLEVLTGEKLSELTQKLMMTDNLPRESFENKPAVSFSGGVAEYIYQKSEQEFNDLGKLLGNHIRSLLSETSLEQIETPEKIRATVIGASGHTLNVSGSTTFISKDRSKIELPIRNLPVLLPQINRHLLSIDYVANQIQDAFTRMDINEGEDNFVLAFTDPVRSVYEKLTIFSKGIVKGLPKTIQTDKPIFLVFETDIGNSVGNVMKRETGISNEILSLDEISVKEGDFMDCGKPLFEDRVFPIVIKSLIFG